MLMENFQQMETMARKFGAKFEGASAVHCGLTKEG